MPNCIVESCTSKKSKRNAMKGVILHVFPPNIDRIKTWLLQTGQDFGNLDEFAQKVLDGKRTDAYRLCSVHFTPECYLDRASKKALKVDAVPTIFHNRDASSLSRARKRRLMTSGNYYDVYSKTKEASTQTHPHLGTKTVKWKARSYVITDPLRIDKIRKKITKSILDLTLEIIYLLTGENYALLKKTSDEHEAQGPITKIPPPSPTPESNYKKILEVTNKINELLTGEVPITFEDVTVYFSMEESEYLEGHKNLGKDILMENPHYQGENIVIVKNEHDELYVRGDETFIDEGIPIEISTDLGDTRVTQRDVEVKKEEGGYVLIKEEEISVEISTDTGDPRDAQRDVKAEEAHMRIKDEEVPVEISTDREDTRDDMSNVKGEEEEGHVRIKEEKIPSEICTGGKFNNMETNSFTLHDGETDDGITDDSSDENPVARNSNPVLPIAHPPPDPPTLGMCFSDHSYPIPHHGDIREGEDVLTSENGRHPHTCSLCRKCFSDKSVLRQHERTHKGEMPYYCLECGKDYLHKSRFISHRRIHTGEKPYSCSKCGKSFANKPDLVRHHRTHTGEKPFSCPDCKKCFTQRVHLIAHQKKHVLQKL